MNERERIVPPIVLPIVVNIDDEKIEDEDAVAYAKERENERIEAHFYQSEGFKD